MLPGLHPGIHLDLHLLFSHVLPYPPHAAKPLTLPPCNWNRLPVGRMSRYSHCQPQALGCCCPPASCKTGERMEGGLALHDLLWEPGRSSVLPGSMLYPVLLCHSCRLKVWSKLQSSTSHISSPAVNQFQTTSCIFSWLWVPYPRAIAIRWSDLSRTLHLSLLKRSPRLRRHWVTIPVLDQKPFISL